MTLFYIHTYETRMSLSFVGIGPYAYSHVEQHVTYAPHIHQERRSSYAPIPSPLSPIHPYIHVKYHNFFPCWGKQCTRLRTSGHAPIARPFLVFQGTEWLARWKQARLHASWTYFHISVLDKDMHTGTTTDRVCV
jgi:hypothetical protein